MHRTGPAILNQLIAGYVLQPNLLTMQAILDRFPVSPGTRADLRSVLESAPSMHIVSRNIFGGEIEYAYSVFAIAHSNLAFLAKG